MSVNPRLGIRSRFRGPAFRAIEAILREDPVLAEHVKTWRSREGAVGEMAMPASGMLPMIGLSPLPNPNKIFGIDATQVNFAVSVQVAVPGTCVDDILALWEAVEDAVVRLKPFRGTTVGDYLCSVLPPQTLVEGLPEVPRGIMNLRPYAPAFFGVDLFRPADDDSYTVQGGVGSLVCFFTRPS